MLDVLLIITVLVGLLVGLAYVVEPSHEDLDPDTYRCLLEDLKKKKDKS